VADPAIGRPLQAAASPLGLGSAPLENPATPLAYNIEFIIIIWGRFPKKIDQFNAHYRQQLLN